MRVPLTTADFLDRAETVYADRPGVIDEAARAGYQVLMTSTPSRSPSRHGLMVVHGRFTVWGHMRAERVAAYARGERWACLGAWATWQAKSAPKRLSPAGYETVRRTLLGRR